MKFVLSGGQATGQQRLDGIPAPVDQAGQLPALGGCEITQHEVGRVHPARRAADAKPDAVIVPRGQRGSNGPQPVMPVVAAAQLQPDRAERDVEIVVHDDYPVRRDLIEIPECGDRTAGQVHVRHRLTERDRQPGQPAGRYRRARPVPPEPRAHPVSEQVGDHVPGVVPVARVLGARITEPRDQPALVRHACSLQAALTFRPVPSAGPFRPVPSASPPSGEPGQAVSSAAGAADSPSGTGAGSPSAGPAASSASMPSPASICSAVGAAMTCSTSSSASTASVEPAGSDRSPACTDAPTVMPSTSTSIPVGMLVASASTATWTSCWSSSPSGATSPVTCTGTSTVTFSPRLTRIRSTCSTEPLIGSRWIALGSASSLPPGSPSSRISTLGVRSASSTAWPGRLTCRGSVPWPYSTAGTRPCRLTWRAAPLPNSCRGSAAMRTPGTAMGLRDTKVPAQPG